MSDTDVVHRMIAAWGRLDSAGILACMAPDAVYHNIPMPELVGQEAIRGFLDSFLAQATACEFHVHNEAVSETGVVFNERTDVFKMANGKEISLPVAGVFEVRDGLISKWRDYFDLGQFQR